MSEATEPSHLSRWKVLKETSPSGKTLFFCLVCGRMSVSPDKKCPDERCAIIEKRFVDAMADKGTRFTLPNSIADELRKEATERMGIEGPVKDLAELDEMGRWLWRVAAKVEPLEKEAVYWMEQYEQLLGEYRGLRERARAGSQEIIGELSSIGPEGVDGTCRRAVVALVARRQRTDSLQKQVNRLEAGLKEALDAIDISEQEIADLQNTLSSAREKSKHGLLAELLGNIGCNCPGNSEELEPEKRCLACRAEEELMRLWLQDGEEKDDR